jgi:hypothetical protein
VVRTFRLMAAVVVVLLAGGTAWAQPNVAPPVPPVAPPFLPPPPGFIPCGAPAPNYYCMPAPNPTANDMSVSDTVYELMQLYRMVYRQGNHEAAAAIARRVEALNPILGQAALGLIGAGSTECRVRWGCCIISGCNACCNAAVACCKVNQAAKTCACGKNCECCKGNTANCACGNSCSCLPAKPIGKYHLELLPLPCPMMFVPVVFRAAAPACTRNQPVCTDRSPCCCRNCNANGCHAQKDTPICITACGGRVHISTPAAEVECDRVTALGQSGQVQLEGHVCVQFHSGDGSAAISAENVSLDVNDGSYTINGLTAGQMVNKPIGCGDASYKVDFHVSNEGH